MKLYEIDAEIQTLVDRLVDSETGELDLLAAEQLEELAGRRQMMLESLIEQVSLSYKNELAYAEALKEEKMKLAEKQKVAENRAGRIKRYLEVLMQATGQDKVRTERGILLSWRKTSSVKVSDWTKLPEEFLRYREPEPDLVALKKFINLGASVNGAELVTGQSLQIK